MMTPPATIGTEMPVPGSDPPGIEPVAAPTAAPTRQPLINPLITAEQVRISELECMVHQLRADLLLLQTALTKPEHKAPKEFELKPMDGRDMKAPPEFDGSRKHFASWHESFTSMLTCRTPKWQSLIDWLKSRKEKKLKDHVCDEYKAWAIANSCVDESVEANFELYQRQLYRHLMDYTKDKQKLEVMAGKEKGIFEAYRNILQKGFNVNDEKRLDIEAKVLHPRSAKNEKDILPALQDWRADQEWLLEAGFASAYKLMHENGGKLAQTVFIKMMPGDGSNSMQKYLREVLSKHETYDELEEEMYRELARREDKKDAGGLNQIDGDSYGVWGGLGLPTDEARAETPASDGGTERSVWDEELGWINVLVPNAAKRPRSDDETPPDSKVPKGYGKGKGKNKGGGKRREPGVCWQCGGSDHYQNDCPLKGKGKGVPLPSAWAAWRPSAWPGPSSAQWRSFMPKGGKGQKGKGTGKGKGKGKGDGKSGDFGAAPMQMGYFGAWDGSHADSWSGWDGFAGNMGLLTAHEKPVEAV